MMDELLKEIEALKKDRELLEELWSEVGPYSSEAKEEAKMIDRVRTKLRNHFKFDDSE